MGRKTRVGIEDIGSLSTKKEKVRVAFPVERCRQLIGEDGLERTDEEALQIRDFLINLAELDYENHQAWFAADSELKKQTIIIPIEPNHYEQQKSNPLFPGEHRRAG